MTDEQLRAEVEAWLALHWTRAAAADSTGAGAGGPWLRQVRDAGWAASTWPAECFGRGLSIEQAHIVGSAFAAVGAPGSGQDRTNLWAKAVQAYGTDALQRATLPGLLTDQFGLCLLYSEPGAGSDLAAVRTSATPTDGGWRVSGQKIWTSRAHIADYGLLAARTDWGAPKHRGISLFFFPMKQQGVEVRPLRQITGESNFNEVFITDALIPEANLLGTVNGGWSVLQTALAWERSIMGDVSRGARSGAIEPEGDYALLGLAREAGRLNDPVVRQDLAAVIALRVLNTLNARRGAASSRQEPPSPLMSLGKLARSRVLHEEARVRTMLLGAESLLEGPEHPRAEDANFLSLNAFFTSIGGGTDQIQRNIIGERVLRLPREPEIDRTIPFRDVRAG